MHSPDPARLLDSERAPHTNRQFPKNVIAALQSLYTHPY
jgi:hypothetical protein